MFEHDINGQDPKMVAQYLEKYLGSTIAEILVHDIGTHYFKLKQKIRIEEFNDISTTLKKTLSFPELNLTGTLYDMAEAFYGKTSELTLKLENLDDVITKIKEELDSLYEAKRQDFMNIADTNLRSTLEYIVKHDVGVGNQIYHQGKQDDGKVNRDEAQKMAKNYLVQRLITFKKTKQGTHTPDQVYNILQKENVLDSAFSI